MNIFREFKAYYWPDRRFLWLSIFSLAVVTTLGFLQPMVVRSLIDHHIVPREFDGIWLLALTLLGIVVVKVCFQYMNGFFGALVGNRLAYRLRNTCYEKLQALSFSYYDTARTGDLMSRLTADLEGMRQFIGFGFAQLLNTFFLILIGFTIMFFIDWQLALIVLAMIPIIGVVAFKFERTIHPVYRSIRIVVSKLTTAVQENITGVRTVKSFAREPFELKKFERENEDYGENHIQLAKVWMRFFPSIEFIPSFSVVVMLIVGGLRVISGSLSLGDLVALNSILGMVIGPLWVIGFQINAYTQSLTSGERLKELLLHPITVKNVPDSIVLDPAQVKGHVKFNNVTFRYRSMDEHMSALADFRLDAPPGAVIGFLGGTGSGKSTAVGLLLRAYDVNEGAITLDGIDIRNLDIQSLRSQIAIVYQESFLFSTTIRENICYGNPYANEEAMIEAAKLAQAHGFISELPEGYETIVGERGMGLSGGQKQRIAIARALLLKPKILILDDATSALDMETEQEIQVAVRQVMKGRTVFIIAHRISSLRFADEIVVLDHGFTVQRGKHDQLIREPGLYRETFRIQYADRPEDLDPVPEAGVGAERKVPG